MYCSMYFRGYGWCDLTLSIGFIHPIILTKCKQHTTMCFNNLQQLINNSSKFNFTTITLNDFHINSQEQQS